MSACDHIMNEDKLNIIEQQLVELERQKKELLTEKKILLNSSAGSIATTQNSKKLSADQKVKLFKKEVTDNTAFFLLDTRTKREASPFINGFLERCKADFYDRKCQTQLVPLVDNAIHTFLHGQWDLLFNTMHELSLFQFRYFDFMILETLANRPGVVKSRNQLMDAAYQDDVYVDDRTIDSHIKRLRRKFREVDPEFDAIDTLYGAGYRYNE